MDKYKDYERHPDGRGKSFTASGPQRNGKSPGNRKRQPSKGVTAQIGAAVYSARSTDTLQLSRERLVLAREEERRRICRDLHDELGPALAGQTFLFDIALELLETDLRAAAGLLRTLKERNQALVGDVRRLVHELRPPALDELGLPDALRAHFCPIVAPTITLSASPDPLPALPAGVEVAAYRIALEAVNNVVRHARANRCAVTLANIGRHFILTVEDDGVGMSVGRPTGIGLRSMRERAEEVGGVFEIGNLTGGLRLTAVLPLGAP